MSAQHALAVRVVVPDGSAYIHAHAYDEIITMVVGGLRRLGLTPVVTTTCAGPATMPTIVLGPHLQPLRDLDRLPRDSVLYTWEPLGHGHHREAMHPALLALMCEFQIWDYSAKNLAVWRTLGARRLTHVPMAWDPALATIGRQADPDIPILFYGSLKPRREKVLREIQALGIEPVVLYEVFGAERDRWISRARLVVNMHVHEAQIMELPRLSRLWASGIPVLTEVSSDTEDPVGIAPFVLTSTYDNFARRAVALTNDPETLHRSRAGALRAASACGDSAAALRRGVASLIQSAGRTTGATSDQ